MTSEMTRTARDRREHHERKKRGTEQDMRERSQALTEDESITLERKKRYVGLSPPCSRE
jgi:hypothetical protein